MNIRVIYATKTNHSKKLAEAVASRLNVSALNIKTNPSVEDTDLLFVVGGIYGGVSSPELLQFLESMKPPYPSRAALITNCASGRQTQRQARLILETKGIPVVDEFVCKGAILFVAMGHPNQQDMRAASDFALRIANP